MLSLIDDCNCGSTANFDPDSVSYAAIIRFFNIANIANITLLARRVRDKTNSNYEHQTTAP
jgi:hypothetical protein